MMGIAGLAAGDFCFGFISKTVRAFEVRVPMQTLQRCETYPLEITVF